MGIPDIYLVGKRDPVKDEMRVGRRDNPHNGDFRPGSGDIVLRRIWQLKWWGFNLDGSRFSRNETTTADFEEPYKVGHTKDGRNL